MPRKINIAVGPCLLIPAQTITCKTNVAYTYQRKRFYVLLEITILEKQEKKKNQCSSELLFTKLQILPRYQGSLHDSNLAKNIVCMFINLKYMLKIFTFHIMIYLKYMWGQVLD
jgi:hypothetical protein